jgi:hypothetical protein
MKECLPAMTAIDRTAYPRFTRAPSGSELRDLYTPTPEELAFVTDTARGESPRLSLLVLLKVFQRLGYFPAPREIPRAIIEHLRAVLHASASTIPDITPRTLYTYHAAIRTYLGISADTEQMQKAASAAIAKAVQVRDDPADLINAAIEMLVKARCELPAYGTLDELANRLRRQVHEQLFQEVLSRLEPSEQVQLERLIQRQGPGHFTAFNRLKEAPKSATLTHLEEWLARLSWLESLGNMERLVEGIPAAKIKHFAAEARALHATHLWDYTPPKRFTLLVCLIHQATISTRDEVVEMFLKRVKRLEDRAKEELEALRERERETTEHLIEVLSDLLSTTRETQDDADMGQQVRQILQRAGGTERLLAQCDQVSAHHGNVYQPLLAQFYTHHRATLFRVLKVLSMHPTTQDQALARAMEFLLAHEQSRKEELEADLDLSFASEAWQRILVARRKTQHRLVRRHLEACIFSYVAAELKTGDLCVRGSEQFADYREQLLCWEDCQPQLADYCQQLGFAPTAEGFVDQLKGWLTEVAALVDRTKPDNQDLVITEQGEPILKKRPRKLPPSGFAQFEALVHVRLPERHLLDMLCHTDQLTGWTRHFGPLSGSDPKMADAQARGILTTFAFGTNMGPYQLGRHLRGSLTGEQLADFNRRHATSDKLDAATRDLINRFHRCHLPGYWGTGKRAAADGTQYDLVEDTLLAEQHIRYGGYGGIAYQHVSDQYIALFSHFISCSVWEAVYIIDGLLNNRSDIQPDTIHADTQGQNLPVFALSYLLGIKLMPRIRNWKDVRFYRPEKGVVYQHIEALFGEEVVDWNLIKTHWQDLFRVVLSIKAGKVLPSTLLRKLTNYSRKNRLYQACKYKF